MSHFAHLRQRIKVIQSIRKTTNAMRMIAMSMQGRIKKRDQQLIAYTTILMRVYNQYLEADQNISGDNDRVHHARESTQNSSGPVVLLIGSQKALCGSFNEQLWHYMLSDHTALFEYPVITIGTQAGAFARSKKMCIIAEYQEFSTVAMAKIAHKIVHTLIARRAQQLWVVSNVSRTFFIQQPQMTQIDCTMAVPPYALDTADDHEAELTAYLGYLHIQAQLTRLLQNSLLAEQSARFLAMDTATRNAESLLETTRLAYNKARQAHVTRELIELTSSYDVV